MITALDFKSTTLAPYEVRQVSVTGSVFFVLTATATFYVSIDGGPFLPFQAGIQLDNRPNLFNTVVLQNQSAVPVTLNWYCGTCAVGYSPVTVNVVSSNAATYTKGTGVLADDAHVFNGLDGSKVRKQFVITNLDLGGNTIYLQDANGNVLAGVPALTAWTCETGGTFKVSNANHVNYCVGETFYA